MQFQGSRKLNASPDAVFQALLSPEKLKNSIPGCEHAEYVDEGDSRQIKLIVTPNLPGLKGAYKVLVQPADVVQPSHLVYIAEPSSSIGSIKARCTIDLTNDAGGTLLNYDAQATLSGSLGAIPEMIVKPAVKSALEHFFKNLEKQIG
ncbi:carbon monoxide dehydrogenase subunit G [Thermosporothrix hazakensis]|jgi:carbon monoxide dehydrogenase subunit G|uniref:Carbon monoxide dehydrogenase subunit G n=1 Tax=Thermosporothrix hazakensis TaxID=644383 RepID=A0A326UCK8_THEHA|nr:SRPBCC domain-containing protein [Thermosporothrix hazakensis]PZW26406.1 carbon monoxide dehydrogenase subunit G [Thermosporothrix hazakensis]GCE48643.1 carbon monoxide dehydrogenase [Thermosporothrix hazakensis]